MKYGYSYEKFTRAMHMMAIGSGSLQDRIADAYIDQAQHAKRDELPDQALQKFDRIAERMRSGTPKGAEGVYMPQPTN